MNHLEHVPHLGNRYYAVRHGKSLANEAAIIVSDPDQGVSGYGLSQEGHWQVASAVTTAIKDYALDHSTLIVSSDFARARESAEMAAGILGTEDIILTPKLRERFFGSWEGQHHGNYEIVWADDAIDGAHKHYGVESTKEVLARVTSLIADLERAHSSRNILLVSHGDSLQILQTAFERVDSGSHRLLPHIDTGQIRKLELKALPSVG